MKLVGVAAHSGSYGEDLEKTSRRFVALLAKKCSDNVALVLGGYWGLMKVVVDEALSWGLTVVILPPVEKEDVDFPEKAIVIRSGTSYRARSVILARSSDVLVALGGGAGVIQEVVTAYTESKPVFLLKSGMDSDRLESLAPHLDYRKLSPILVYNNIEALVNDLCLYLTELKSRASSEHG
ncbi:MAG: hypothetical protein QW065_04765 [Acidilobaceae archaeon]